MTRNQCFSKSRVMLIPYADFRRKDSIQGDGRVSVIAIFHGRSTMQFTNRMNINILRCPCIKRKLYLI